VAQLGNPHAISSKSERVFGERGWEQLKWVWQRIWTEAPEVARYRGDQSSMSINEHRVGVSRPSSQFGSQSSRRLAGSQL
jgi:hypothetical protein